MIGQTVLGYKVEEELGSGGFGTVYKVSKTDASGTYIRALKHITVPTQKQYADVLNSMGGDYSKADDYFASVLKEIVNEIQIISRLSEAGASNIVRYYDHEINETQSPKRYDIFILMECLTPFPDYFMKNELKVNDVIKLGKDILHALISCHKQHIIHRDIKDDNIFVDSEGNYRLGDFGVSKMLKDRTRAESVKGTPNFIAPEVYLGKDTYDETVDLYSLGVVMYRLLNKTRNPFMPSYPETYTSADEDAAFEKRMTGESPALPHDANNILGEAIIKAIQPRQTRYNSAQEFLSALEMAEKSMSQEELNVSINSVIYSDVTKPVPKQEESSLSETIGTDVENALDSFKNQYDDDRDIFETISDTYHKTPVQVSSAVNFENGEGQNSSQESYTNPNKENSNVNNDIRENITFSSDSVSKNYSNNSCVNYPNNIESKSDHKMLARILPILFIAVYIIIYLIILPKAYGKGISIIKWMFNNPSDILNVLQNQNAIFPPVYAIIGFKILMWGLLVGFIASLFYLGRVLQNDKPQTNLNAILKGREAYLKALEINNEVKVIKNTEINEVKIAVRNLTEKLRNESDFGLGSDNIIVCENDISRSLKEIEDNVHALYDKKDAKNAGIVIIRDCQIIQSKLNIRTELKRR